MRRLGRWLLRALLGWSHGTGTMLAPGIRAEVTLVLSDQGHVALYFSKLPPSENPSVVYEPLLMRFLAGLSELGVALDFTAEDGQAFPLVRPSEMALKRMAVDQWNREKAAGLR